MEARLPYMYDQLQTAATEADVLIVKEGGN